jgi:hypothetical protein
MKKCTLALIFVALLSIPAAQASAIFATGNASMTENVLFGHSTCVGCVDGPAVTVVGHGQNSNILVDFQNFDNPTVNLVISGANTITYDPSGQAGFGLLNIAAPGYYITGIMFQLTEISTVTDGTVTFTAHTTGGDVISNALTLLHQGGGLNQFNVTTTGGTLISSLDISASDLLHDISQVSITLQAVPEPASYGIVGAALAGLALWRRRRT